MNLCRDSRKAFAFISIGALAALVSACAGLKGGGEAPKYPSAAEAVKAGKSAVVPGPAPETPLRLDEVAKFKEKGYGAWTFGPGLAMDKRTDIMPEGYVVPSLPRVKELLNFFAITDIHITDKESPSQLIYLQQLTDPATGRQPWSFVTSIYSPVMLYTTQVLDAAVQTINALHKESPFDFGISLGDTSNSTQYDELRWYIDVLDGKAVRPSSGNHAGEANIDYQKPFKAAGLDRTIPWYQALGNHDHFWIGSIPIDDYLRASYVSDTIISMGDVLADPRNVVKHDYYMGAIDGTTPYGDIKGAGYRDNFFSPPKIVADPDRRSLSRSEWLKAFSDTASSPVGHGFGPNQAEKGFACYSFVPKSTVPIKVIVLDDTQREDDGSADIHGHGFLDKERYDWLKAELDAGQADGQLMIIAAHIPIGVEKPGSELGWWNDKLNAVTEPDLVAMLQSHPNFILWIAGHRHLNTVKAFPGESPENSFWQVETSSLRDFPQQFRTFGIFLNSDYSVSIVATDVDPIVREGTPAAKSRFYAVAAQQIVKTDIYSVNPNDDPSIKPMPTGSYDAELVKVLTPEMREKLKDRY